VTDAILVVPAETRQVAYQAVVQYNFAIEAMIEAPPGVTRGWVENALEEWNGTEPLDTSLNEFGFDGTMVSSGEPRVVTLTLHRNPGAWTSEACQGAPIYQDGMGPEFEVGEDEVLVFFGCEWVPNESRAVLRSVADVGTISDRLIVALEALFDGPTSEEEELGYHGTVPAEWGVIPFSVELLPDGLAILDFDDAILLGSVPNTSAQLGSLSFSISATAFQFLEVTAIELRVRGSCGAFAVWLGEVGQCIHQAEPVEAVSDCPIVEPMTLPSGAPLTPARSYRNLGGGLSWGSGDDTVTQWVSHRSSITLEQLADATGAVAIMVGDREGWAFPDGRELESGIIRPMIAWDDGQGCVYTAYFAAGASLDDLEQGADSFAGLPHDGPIYAGWWSLRSGERDGQAVPADATGSSLFIDSHSLSGRAPCNSYGAEFELDGETISVGRILQSLAFCSDGTEAAETAYLSALSSVTTARIEGGELVFIGPDVELRFTR
jgi:heat shock protein HslJ